MTTAEVEQEREDPRYYRRRIHVNLPKPNGNRVPPGVVLAGLLVVRKIVIAIAVADIIVLPTGRLMSLTGTTATATTNPIILLIKKTILVPIWPKSKAGSIYVRDLLFLNLTIHPEELYVVPFEKWMDRPMNILPWKNALRLCVLNLDPIIILL